MFKVIKLSSNTKDYIANYYKVFEEMKNKMQSVELTDSISLNYIRQMLPHHQAEVEMSANILRFTTDAEIEALAQQFISDATKQIEKMGQIAETCYAIKNNEQDVQLYQKAYLQAFARMIQAMQVTPGDNQVDIAFLTEMIPHHEGAISMSKNLLRFDVCSEIVALVTPTIEQQTRQVQQMQEMLRRRQGLKW